MFKANVPKNKKRPYKYITYDFLDDVIKNTNDDKLKKLCVKLKKSVVYNIKINKYSIQRRYVVNQEDEIYKYIECNSWFPKLKNNITLQCPSCNQKIIVTHLDWFQIVCLGCSEMKLRDEFLIKIMDHEIVPKDKKRPYKYITYCKSIN